MPTFRDLSEIGDTLDTAIRDRSVVQASYRSMRHSRPQVHEIEPYHLAYVDGTLYLVARHRERGKVLTFAVERFESVEIVDGPGFTVPEGFDPLAYVDAGFGAWNEGDRVQIVIEFDAEKAPYIRERLWHPSQEIVEIQGGGVRATYLTAGPTGVLNWVLSFGRHARVVAPRSFATRVAEEARALVARYRSTRPRADEVAGARGRRPRRVGAVDRSERAVPKTRHPDG